MNKTTRRWRIEDEKSRGIIGRKNVQHRPSLAHFELEHLETGIASSFYSSVFASNYCRPTSLSSPTLPVHPSIHLSILLLLLPFRSSPGPRTRTRTRDGPRVSQAALSLPPSSLSQGLTCPDLTTHRTTPHTTNQRCVRPFHRPSIRPLFLVVTRVE